MKTLPFILTSGLMLGSIAATAYASELPGYADGAQIIRVDQTLALLIPSTAWFTARLKMQFPFVRCICLCWCRETTI
ncbi:peptidase, S15 family [Klebsiella quasivariicola]|nr:peptidase, S15 family [Klebsiella quasivariicola]